MRGSLRLIAGLSAHGSTSDIQVWREDGPNCDPTWTELQLDWSAKQWQDLGVAHGDVLVV